MDTYVDLAALGRVLLVVLGAAMWWIGHLFGGLAGGLVVFAILLIAAGFMYLRSRRAPIDHHNVNADWDLTAPQDDPRVPAGTAS